MEIQNAALLNRLRIVGGRTSFNCIYLLNKYIFLLGEFAVEFSVLIFTELMKKVFDVSCVVKKYFKLRILE